MKKKIILIDSGHGGIINGVPQTAGKRSPDFGKGILYEGVINRAIAKKTIALLLKAGVPAVELVPEITDISLGERVRRANKYKEAIFVSLHCNAGVETASGWEIFTSKGKTASDEIAEEIYVEMKKAFPKAKFRTDTSDSDSDKEENFFVLDKTSCPAVLVENFFMTNKEDYNILMSEEGQNKISAAICNALKKFVL
jgi:N-acetylmuramoyl-L-alanine amidase